MNKSESKYFHTAVKFDKALLALLEKKPLEYITISEVCKAAGVNRSTFYLHYENMSDLLRETGDYVLQGFVSYFSVDEQGLSGSFADGQLQDLNFISDRYLHPYLRYVKDHSRLFKAVLAQPMSFETNAVYQRLFDHVLNPILERYHYPEDHRRYVMMFYLNGLIAVVKEWLQDDCGKSIEEISAIMRCCVFGKDA